MRLGRARLRAAARPRDAIGHCAGAGLAPARGAATACRDFSPADRHFLTGASAFAWFRALESPLLLVRP
jgi:hypothetical protein